MSFTCTVERAALALALKRLALVADDPAAAGAPILAGVMMRANGDGLTLESTDLAAVARVTIPAKVDRPGEAVAKLQPLEALAAKLPAGALVELAGVGADRVSLVAGRFRAGLLGFPACDWPALKPPAPAFSFAMPARLALDMLKAVARDAAPPADKGAAGDDLGARLVLASDGMAWLAGRSHSITRRAYPLPRLMAGGLAFAPKPGADIAATFTRDALASLAKMIDKPGKNDGDGRPVTFAFSVVEGTVTAMTLEAGGLSATVRVHHEGHCAARLAYAESALFGAAADWCDLDAAGLAATAEAAARAGEGAAVTIQPAGDGLAIGDTSLAGNVLGAIDPDSLPIGLNVAALARACAGADRVTLALNPAMRLLLVRRGDGVAVALSARFANPKELGARAFARDYGAAWAARDGVAMAEAVAALKAAGGDPVQQAAAVRGHGRRQQVKRRGLAIKKQEREVYRDSLRWNLDRLEARRDAILQAAIDTARGYRLFRDRRGPVQVIPLDDGRAARLVSGVKGKESFPPHHVTDAQLARFESLYPAGFDGQAGDYVQSSYSGRKYRPGFTSWAIFHPEGLAIPKAKRGKAEIQPAGAPEAVAAPDMPADAVNVASGPEIAPAPAIPADDLPATPPTPADLPPPGPVPVPPGYPIPHAPADAALPDDLAATVAGLVATVAALQARLDALSVAEARAQPNANIGPDCQPEPAPADDMAERLAAAEARADALAAELATANARIAGQEAWIDGAAAQEERAAAVIADLQADVGKWREAWARLAVKRHRTARRLKATRAALAASRSDAAAGLALATEGEARLADAMARLAAAEASRADLAQALARARVQSPLAGIVYTMKDQAGRRWAKSA